MADGSNETLGVDANLSFLSDFYLSGYYAETRTAGLKDDDQSYRGAFSYSGDLWEASVTHLRVGENFNSEVGFLRRRGFRATTILARLSPRPESDLIRRVSLQAGTDYVENDAQGFVESRESQATAQIEFESSDAVDLTYADRYEFLKDDFRIADDVTLPSGRYSFRDLTLGLSLGVQRWYSGNLSFQRGSFYSGHRTTAELRGGRITLSNRFSLEPTVSLNRIYLPEGSFQTDLLVIRMNYAFSAWMYFSGLVQYNTGNDSFSTNLRLRCEYRPGSELFIVYSEVRDTDVLDRFSMLENRGLTVKLTYLLRL